MSSVRLGTSREKGPFCYELGEYLDLHRCLVYCPSLKIRILVKFLKGHWGFWIPNNSSSAAQSSASIVCITFLLCNPGACFFLHVAPLSFALPTTLSPRLNDTDLAIHSQISAAWIQLLSCLGLAWRNRDITTHKWGWMRVAICMQLSADFSAETLVILWGYHWIQGKNQWQIKFIVNVCILFVCLCGQHVFSAVPRYRSFWKLLMPVTFVTIAPAPIV